MSESIFLHEAMLKMEDPNRWIIMHRRSLAVRY